MKNIKRIFTLMLVVSLTAFATAQRPIVQTSFTADPAPMVYNDTVFLYTSHDEDDAPAGQGQFRMKNWLLYTSTDMVNWTDHGVVASLTDFSWMTRDNGAWALEVIERNGKFYMYCPLHGNGIGVLVSDSPYGPFVDPIGKPIVWQKEHWEDIDPTVLIDDDGQAWMYWGNPNLYYVKLNEDMISISGQIIKDPLVRKVEGQANPYHYQEGPWVYKREGRYYMAYASTCCPEGIGYAMADSPIGPWEFKGYIMPPDRRATGNHPGIIDYKGRSYVFGFNFSLNFAITDQHHERRSVCVAEITYNPDGTIRELPWWAEVKEVEQFQSINPYQRIEAETISWSEGLKTARSAAVGMYVTQSHAGDYFIVKGVDFGEGASSFEISAASITGGEIEIRLGGPEGRQIGICDISNTIALNFWKTFIARVDRVEGVHDLCLVFRGGRNELFNLDYWKFSK
ncbi:MAG: glycoside hydrolase family 43 protein [Bacteroidales bacterium]|jgi:hypothetical protein|nr:glycoside hydrolase family 43 protein [Bacteroidales bacterium]